MAEETPENEQNERTEHVHHEHNEEHHKDEHEKAKDHERAEKESLKHMSEERRDLRDTRIATMAFILAGAGIGILSFFLNMDTISLFIGFLALAGLTMGMKRYLNRKTKFFIGSIFVYLFIWLVAWVFLFNL